VLLVLVALLNFRGAVLYFLFPEQTAEKNRKLVARFGLEQQMPAVFYSVALIRLAGVLCAILGVFWLAAAWIGPQFVPPR
jgi:hypothetical protein